MINNDDNSEVLYGEQDHEHKKSLEHFVAAGSTDTVENGTLIQNLSNEDADFLLGVIIADDEDGILRAVTLEQKQKMIEITVAMAEKFKVSPLDFSLLSFKTPNIERNIALAYSASSGLYKGSWDAVMGDANNDEFIVEISDEFFDTRSGMTTDVYNAMYEAKLNDNVLPDSQEAALDDPLKWTLTMMSEQPNGNYASFMFVKNGKLRKYWYRRTLDHEIVRFRPAIIIN